MPPRLPFLVLAVITACGPLTAQAVERTDTPRAGALRVTFDPRIMTWDQVYAPAGRRGIGAAFSGDSIAEALPSVVRLQQEVRSLTGLMGYVATLGHELLAVRAERRVMPIRLEYGISDRLSLGVTVPIVRVDVREHYQRAPPGATLGALSMSAQDSTRYLAFFDDLDTALARLSDSIDAGAYGGPGSDAYSRAQELLTQGQMMRLVLGHAVDTTAQYLPLAGSEAGQRITALVTALGQSLADSFNIDAFARDTFLLPTEPLSASAIAALYAQASDGLDLSPYGESTARRLRFFTGDVEVAARYRFRVGPAYAATAGILVRLPTGHQDSPNDPFDLATGDHQTDIEANLTQELLFRKRLWLNLALRAARQLPGQRDRRVGPLDQLFLPATTVTRLRWDPGDYLAADIAPMYRFSPHFAAGFTAAYYTQQRDRYSFLSPEDSTALATQSGAPISASVLDAGTGVRVARVGLAVTYLGPRAEGGFSVERTVSGAGGLVPAATVFRIVLRQSFQLF